MEREEEEEDHHRLLKLFDSFWFYNPILFHKPKPLLLHPPPPPQLPETAPELKIKAVLQSTSIKRPHRRSQSDEQVQLSSSSGDGGADHVKLETILSGKEGVVSEDTKVEIKKVGRFKKRRMRRSGSSKSLSDLEFEELKGFMDLGFTFSDAETDPRLMSIVPALRRRATCDENKDVINDSHDNHDSHGDNEGEEEQQQEGIVRPYLSEAWEVEEEKRLKNWMIPVPVDGEDMKDSLRSWARAVASTVR